MLERFADSRIPVDGRGGGPDHSPGAEYCPAFKDERSGVVYLSRHADGSCAAVHLMEGLPEALVRERDATGRAVGLHEGVIAGYVRAGRFLTREQARQDAEARGRGPGPA